MPEWLRAYYTGCDNGPNPPVVVFEGVRLAVVLIPGHHYFGGLGQPRPYAPQHYDLIQKDGVFYKADWRVGRLHEGRATKAVLGMLKRRLEEAEAQPCGQTGRTTTGREGGARGRGPAPARGADAAPSSPAPARGAARTSPSASAAETEPSSADGVSGTSKRTARTTRRGSRAGARSTAGSTATGGGRGSFDEKTRPTEPTSNARRGSSGP